ncbi:MAG: hypothetical protein ACE5JL_19900 [Dehalococcoidia bacterium]
MVFFTVLAQPVSAKPGGALKSDLYIELQWDWVGFPEGTDPCTWRGTVTGDINGAICITLTWASFPGKTEHFSEAWTITTDLGDIEGLVHKGVWRFANFKWVANGEVTDATGAWSDLVGSRWHYSGTTTEFPVPPGTPVSGTGTIMITP